MTWSASIQRRIRKGGASLVQWALLIVVQIKVVAMSRTLEASRGSVGAMEIVQFLPLTCFITESASCTCEAPGQEPNLLSIWVRTPKTAGAEERIHQARGPWTI